MLKTKICTTAPKRKRDKDDEIVNDCDDSDIEFVDKPSSAKKRGKPFVAGGSNYKQSKLMTFMNWTCIVCTFINENNVLVCSMCNIDQH